MAKKYVAAIDQGTTSTRFIVFDRQGQIICRNQQEHQQIYPQPGWVEHNPEEIWQRTQSVIKNAFAIGNIDPKDIAALGITNQRETTIIWDRNTGKPYGNAIVWQDTRTRFICEQLAEAEGKDRFRERCGLPLATYFSGPKIKWMLDNIPGLREAANQGDAIFGNVDTFLIWHLTGGAHITDVTNASRTMLMDLQTLDWDAETLEIMAIPARCCQKFALRVKFLELQKDCLQVFRLLLLWAISKPPSSGKLVSVPGRRKILTVRAVLCC